jgi:fermentation-respiration switch protein FrsA (DUF1100 family)
MAAMTVLKWLIIVGCLGYGSALAVLIFAQRSFIYPIPQATRTSPEAAGLGEAEEHVLTTDDGERMVLWHVPAKPGRHVVLYFHGNGDVLAWLAGRFRDITADGTGLVAMSYRGYGGSSGSPSEAALLRDATAAYDFARARYDAKRIVAWGFSLGTGVAVAVAAGHPVGGLILEAPYTSIADVAARAFPYLPVRPFMRDSFRSDERIARVTAPLLIMHGVRDPVIPIALGEKLFALAHEPKQFVRFPDGEHNDLGNFGAVETARQFIAALKG